MFGRPYSRTLRVLMTVPLAWATALTRAFQCSSIVIPGGMSIRHVMIVLPPATTRPGVAAAQPEGVMVQPEQGSSKPILGPHTSRSAGTVSQRATFHQVFVVERFRMN